MTYRSSFAADFDDVDTVIPDTTPLRLAPTRVLWDLNGDYYDERFYCPADGIYSFTACLAVKDLVNVDAVQLHLYQNGEIWATLDEKIIMSGRTKTFLQAACPSDGLYSSDDYFEVYVELIPVNPLLPCTGAVSGSREQSFFGFDILTEVHANEIDSAD